MRPNLDLTPQKKEGKSKKKSCDRPNKKRPSPSQPSSFPVIPHDLPVLAGLLFVPEDAAENLAAGALGDLVQELDLHDPLVPDLLLLHVFDDAFAGFVLVALGRRLEDDVRLGSLACPVVRDAEDGAIFHLGMAEQEVFELGGGHADAWEKRVEVSGTLADGYSSGTYL